MTSLNIRRNAAGALLRLAAVIEDVKVPTKAQATEKLSEYRIRAAALMIPKDCCIVVTVKQD